MQNELKKESIGFTQISNTLLNDSELSAKSKGIYCYLFSKPANWEFSSVRIAKQFKDGRDGIRSGLKELEEKGYVKINKLPSGRMEYLLLCKPKPEKPSLDECKPKPEKAKDGNGHCGQSRPISNKDIIVTKSNSNKDIAETSSAPADLLKDNQRHIQIIGLYGKAKRIEFKTKEQQSSFIKRNLRPAKDLIGYQVQEIINTMKYLIDEADFKWTLETVGKYIDEDLIALKTKTAKSDDDLIENFINNN